MIASPCASFMSWSCLSVSYLSGKEVLRSQLSMDGGVYILKI